MVSEFIKKLNEENPFTPQVGMEPDTDEGNGYKGKIEYVGPDYFILRSARTDEPIMIKPFQYHNFTNWSVKEYNQHVNPIFQNLLNNFAENGR